MTDMEDIDIRKEADSLIKDINKEFGEGSLVGFDGTSSIISIPRESTGSRLIDMALGGGWAVGRVHELVGMESCGKTMMCTLSMIEYQRRHPDKLVAIIDVENAFDIEYATRMGLDIGRFLISQPSYGELAIDITRQLVKSRKVGFIVVDSVANLVPKREIEGEMEDGNVGLQARLMAKALRVLTSDVNNSDCVLVFINQYREKIGVMYGDPKVTTGGNALKFYASIRMEMSRKKQVLDKDGNPIGHEVKVKVLKNKTAMPFKVAETILYYGVGFDRVTETLTMSEALGILTKKGSWYWYGDTRVGNGVDNTIATLRDNPEVMDELDAEITRRTGK